jgi:hypothetical protein
VNERLPQIFRRSLAPPFPRNNLSRGSIVFHDEGMIDRNVGNALIEVSHRISPSGHDFRHQTVRFVNRAAGIVNKQCLYVMPDFAEPCRFVGRQLTNLKSGDPLFPRCEIGFGSTDIANLA